MDEKKPKGVPGSPPKLIPIGVRENEREGEDEEEEVPLKEEPQVGDIRQSWHGIVK